LKDLKESQHKVLILETKSDNLAKEVELNKSSKVRVDDLEQILENYKIKNINLDCENKLLETNLHEIKIKLNSVQKVVESIKTKKQNYE